MELDIPCANGSGFVGDTAILYSTLGQVFRYQQQFNKAWFAYTEAERIFDELQDSSWLGTIYQQQAICLFQAYLDGLMLVDDRDPLEYAREKALSAVDTAGRAVGQKLPVSPEPGRPHRRAHRPRGGAATARRRDRGRPQDV